MKKINTYIIEKLRINKDSKLDNLDNDDKIEEIENIINDYFRNKLHLSPSQFIYSLFNEKTSQAKSIDELNHIIILSKEFNQYNDIFKTAEYLFEEINKIVSLDKEKTEIYGTIIYFYPKNNEKA